MNVVKENEGLAVVEIDGDFSVVHIDYARHQVFAALTTDNAGCDLGSATFDESGIREIATAHSEETAIDEYQREIESATVFM